MKKLLILLTFICLNTVMQAQDPVRTPKNHGNDPVNTVNGSTGKYKDKHKTSNGKHFATNKRKIKKAKTESGKEKQTARNTEKGS